MCFLTFYNASKEEKIKLFLEVVREASEDQRKLLKEYERKFKVMQLEDNKRDIDLIEKRMKHQVWVIHGGTTFDTYEEYIAYLHNKEVNLDRLLSRDWKMNLQESLGDEYQVIAPRMPNANNAKYKEWKIWFDKLVPLMTGEVILIGHSLGGIFLAKYLSEEKPFAHIKATILVAAPYDTEGMDESLGDFVLPKDLSQLSQQGGEVMLYQSEDDPIVPFLQIEKYHIALPDAKMRIFTDRQHFNQETFPELVEDIRNLK